MITSTHNKRVVKAVRLKKRAMRERDRRFLVEGAQGVAEALSSKASVQEVFYTGAAEARLEPVLKAAGDRGIPPTAVSAEVMEHLTSTVTPQGVVAVADFLDVPLSDVPAGGCLAILTEVRDPGNAGTILRSADASGASGVVFTSSSVDVYNTKAVRATAGSLFHVPVVREVETGAAVDELRSRGFSILAAAADGRNTVYGANLSRPTAVLFGNEASGLTDSARSLADETVRVPIQGRAESLNLAAAATLILFEAARQRAGAGREGRGSSGGAAAVEEDKALARIVAGAAHDIRSPLTALKGFVSTLIGRWDRLTEDQRKMMLEGVAHDGTRMGIIVTQLVEAARLTSGALELSLVRTDLIEVAEEARREAESGPEIEAVLSGDPTIAIADPARLKTVLVALIEGAKWWGEEGPVHVDVASSPDPGVRVWRSGSTLATEDAPMLFTPRAPGTGSGSKVGLFVARGLVAAMGGRLDVTALPDVRFSLTLPAAGKASR